MHFPRYWVKAHHQATVDGDSFPVGCWRWSDTSLAEARERAEQAAQELAEAYSRSAELPQQYGYGDQPPREPVLRYIQAAGGDCLAAVTRNHYGCQVLSTTGAMFIDVDFNGPGSDPSVLKRIILMFSDGEPAAPGLRRAHRWVARHPHWGFRVYRTAAGLRLLATHDTLAPDLVNTQEVFDALGADPLYRRLCGLQQSYRARLTPKPWRCGCHAPGQQWPWADEATEASFAHWKRDYDEHSRHFATCQFVQSMGNTRVHPDIEPLIALHDEATGAHSGRPLA